MLPQWIIMVAAMLMLLLIMWQTFIEARKNRPSKLAEKARAEAEQIISEAQAQARKLEEDARKSADDLLKDSRVDAKEAVIAARDAFEKSCAERRTEITQAEARLEQKEDNLARKLEQLQERLLELDKRDSDNRARSEALKTAERELRSAQEHQQEALLKIASMSRDEARREVMQRLEMSMETERGQLIRRYQEENRQRLIAEGQQIMVDAMNRYSGECTYERTTSTIPLPNDEMKGRIIGREGRNIRTIEAATGASILIDDTPQAVVISCFDPVRREIARMTMEKLINDGRIHPSRVEEVVAKSRKEVENTIQKCGQETVEKLGIPNVRPNIVALLGTLKFRYSFSQNVLSHAIEVAGMAGAIAAELGLDEQMARRAGLFHDIGKAVDHEVEGSHATIGADILRRAGENEVVINAVAAHHEDVEKTSLLAVLIQICDTVSASRPGARSETTELYLKRLEDLEAIGNSFDGVESCFAVQAGRELRVVVKPEEISEEAASVLAREMAERIEKEMRYPGQIRISIIRETRAVEYAK
ncbi:MAG: ribonuclease Y [Victivallales bacterium]|nr:ribonuclease Y [Victivallales bacterium]